MRHRAHCLIAVAGLIAACASSSRPAGPVPILADAAAVVDDRPDRPGGADGPSRTEIGRSRRKRAIEMVDFGGDGPAVLVIGGIHGDEPTSASVVQRLVDEITRHPELAEGLRLVVIAVSNPDGLAAGTRVNARGVDLNRNFPARNWRHAAGRSLRRGDAPASEPETRALLTQLARVQPALIVSIHSIGGGRHCNNFDGPARHLAEAMAEHNGYPARASIGYPTPGSLGSWAGVDRGLPTITLELPRSVPGNLVWKDNRDGLVELIRSVTIPTDAPEGR